MRDRGIASQPPSTTVEHATRQVVDQAVGVLILAMRLTPDTAAQLLSEAARRHLLTKERLGAAVVAAASGQHLDDPMALEVVCQEWGDLLL